MEIYKMTIDELLEEYWEWSENVKSATGWPSAYMAARELEGICNYAKSKGFNLVNKHPIRVGQ
jgi:hypothetical protein